MYKGKTPAEIQSSISDMYYAHLMEVGYLDDVRSSQLLTAILLLDTLDFFAEYIDDSYIKKVEKYLRKAKCCNCAIKWDKVALAKCTICQEEPATKYTVMLQKGSSQYEATIEYIGDGVALHQYLQQNEVVWPYISSYLTSIPSNVKVLEHSDGALYDTSTLKVITDAYPHFFIFGSKESPSYGPPSGSNSSVIFGLAGATPTVGMEIYWASNTSTGGVLTSYSAKDDDALLYTIVQVTAA